MVIARVNIPRKYVCAALLLQFSGQPITEENVKKIVTAAGGFVDGRYVQALVDEVNRRVSNYLGALN